MTIRSRSWPYNTSLPPHGKHFWSVLALHRHYPALREFVVREIIEQAQATLVTAHSELTTAQGQLATLHREVKASAPELEADLKEVEETVALAEKKRFTAQIKLDAVTACIAAERAKHKVTSVTPSILEQLIRAAARTERLTTLAATDEKLLAAQQKLSRARNAAAQNNEDQSKRAVAKAEEVVAAAQKAFAHAQEQNTRATSTYQPLGPTYPRSSTGRRLALARWIANPDNPLTARIAVNHIWLRHFGRPLVESVDDFGLRCPRPALILLLDYLAVELMENNWSMKHVHRLVVTSNAYQRDSKQPAADEQGMQSQAAALDPDNKFFWRMNVRRMEAETVRDSVLWVAQSLDLAAGGPDIDHNRGMTVPRRSLYFRHARERQMEFLQVFDAANPRECYRRLESIQPQQALALINSPLALAQSRRLAGRITSELRNRIKLEEGESINEDSFMITAFETVLSRSPTEAELIEGRDFLLLQAQQLAEPNSLELIGTADNPVTPAADPEQRESENLVLVLFNHNDFVTVR